MTNKWLNDGTMVTLGAVAALAAAGMARQRGSSRTGSGNAEGLPYTLYGSTGGWCNYSEDLIYPWKPGEPVPTNQELYAHAKKTIEEGEGNFDCDWDFDDDSPWIEPGSYARPGFELRPTLAGPKVVLK